MEIHLIRHTAPKIATGVCYGQSDIPIGDDFAIDSKKIIDLLPKQIDGIYSSPLSRCKMLASKIAASIEYSEGITLDDRLIEMNFGQWEMKKWCEIPRDEFMQWEKDIVLNSTPNGESFAVLCSRVHAFLQDLIKTDHMKVIVVTHAGVIRCLLSIINKIPLIDTLKITINYGAVNVINA
jgi:alpha-ribazole phosphatase